MDSVDQMVKSLDDFFGGITDGFLQFHLGGGALGGTVAEKEIDSRSLGSPALFRPSRQCIPKNVPVTSVPRGPTKIAQASANFPKDRFGYGIREEIESGNGATSPHTQLMDIFRIV
jgi:hypothetical protein